MESKQLEIMDEEMLSYLAEHMPKTPDLQFNVLQGRRVKMEGINSEAELIAGLFLPEEEAKLSDEEFSCIAGELQTGSGHKFHSLMDVCHIDSMELYGIWLFVLTRKGTSGPYEWEVLRQGTDEFDAWRAEMEDGVPGFKLFPYRYKYYNREMRATDHHVDEETGWSVV